MRNTVYDEQNTSFQEIQADSSRFQNTPIITKIPTEVKVYTLGKNYLRMNLRDVVVEMLYAEHKHFHPMKHETLTKYVESRVGALIPTKLLYMHVLVMMNSAA